MKNTLIIILIGIIIFFCFRQIADKFIYGWIAGIIYNLISNLINKANEHTKNSQR